MDFVHLLSGSLCSAAADIGNDGVVHIIIIIIIIITTTTTTTTTIIII
jgi:hypothetical protein